ncbi:MAG: phage baseplate assembly protein V [Deltaproteobacteria bacterium]|jgi:uncharacterized protein involved in type VI secretion and phage assembly|nr:phage baseplate assembly protein V [Deltaproteobacteria bacterium]
MSLLEILQPNEDYLFKRDAISGVVVGIVTNNEDPDGLGRIKIKFPWLSDEHESDWARVVSIMAGNGRGVFFLPEVDDEVLVAFEFGDIRKPLVLGGLWNGVDTPPIDNADGENNIRLIHSRSGHMIRLDDTDGSEKIEIIGKGEEDKIVIDTEKNAITISVAGDITLSAPDGKITLECNELELNASSSAKLVSDQSADVEAGATLNLKGQTVNIN